MGFGSLKTAATHWAQVSMARKSEHGVMSAHLAFTLLIIILQWEKAEPFSNNAELKTIAESRLGTGGAIATARPDAMIHAENAFLRNWILT